MQYPEKGESQHPQGKFPPRAKRSHRVIVGDDPVDKIDPSGNDAIDDEPYVLWPGSLAKPNSVRAFITFSGFNPANPSSMQQLANRANGTPALELNNHAARFTYQQVGNAVNYITAMSAQNPGKTVEVVCAGHSLGGSAVDLFASKLNGISNVEVDGMYYFDAVGYANSSDPGNNKRTYLLSIANAPYVNPEEISPNVKNFGMFYQRASSWTGFTAWGINQYFAGGSTNVQFDMEVQGVNHTTIATNPNVQNAVLNEARSDYH